MEVQEYMVVEDCMGQLIKKKTQEAIAILSKWFEKLQNGTHVHAIPDPFYPEKIPAADIAHLISELDADLMDNEYWRVGNPYYNLDKMPEFDRLCKNAQKCMVQELYTLWKYQDAHPEEYVTTLFADDPEDILMNFAGYPIIRHFDGDTEIIVLMI